MFSQILDTLASFVTQSQEYQGWGWNVLTFGAILAVGTMLLECWGLWKQIKTLWSPTTINADGVSVTKKLLAVFYFFTAFGYALTIQSLGLSAGLVVGILQVAIVFGLWRIKRFTRYEWVLVVTCAVAIVGAFVTPWRSEFFFAATIAIVPGLAAQPIEMYVKRTAAGLNPRDPLSFLISSSIWISYGLALGSNLIAGMSLLYACFYAATLILWLRLRTQ